MAELQEKWKKNQELAKKGSNPGLDPFSETQNNENQTNPILKVIRLVF